MKKELFRDYLKSWPFYCLPHHLISRCIFFLTRLHNPLKNPFIRWFIRTFKVDMSEASEQNIESYPTFNAFFTRAIRLELRPVARETDAFACPVDGNISQLGKIEDGQIFQAKGHRYSLLELLGGQKTWADRFAQGKFITLYLSPRDYHRIHMPHDGRLKHMLYVPGRLFSVAPHTVRVIPRLFARNERVINYFAGPAGEFVLILVGAINVAAMETVWHGLITPPQKSIYRVDYDNENITLGKGDEMGRFNMGSTVILITGANTEWEPHLAAGQKVILGQKLAGIK